MLNPIQPAIAGRVDAFVSRFNAAGALDYSTYLGGGDDDTGYGIAVDGEGNAYVAGHTASQDFHTQNAFQPGFGGTEFGLVRGDAFVTKINAAGSDYVYSTYLGGASGEEGHAIAVDAVGHAYVTGFTGSADDPATTAFDEGFPLQNPIQAGLRGVYDAFVTELDVDGSGLVFSTYLGGDGADFGNGIAVDGMGRVYVAGQTGSNNFPTEQPTQLGNAGGATGADAFVTRIDAGGTTLSFSTYLGGSEDEAALAVAVGPGEDPVVVGHTQSNEDFPLVAPLMPESIGGSGGTGFISKIVLAPVANQPPVLPPIANRAATEGSPLSFTITANDPDAGQSLHYSLDPGAPAGATINPTSGLFTWTPPDGPASVQVTVRVRDDGSPVLSDARTFTINVANVVPAVTAGADAAFAVGGTLNRPGSFTDPGADTWMATVDYDDGAGPQLLPLNPNKSFLLDHTYATAGTFNVTVAVSDEDNGGRGEAHFVIRVNGPPVLTAIPDRSTFEGLPLSFAVTANDPNGEQHLTYSLDPGAPTGASITPTGQFTWTPPDGPASAQITVRVRDDGTPNLSDTRTFTVNVANLAPTVTAGGSVTVLRGTTVTRSDSFADLGADTWMATVDYGDGGGPHELPLAPNKSFTLSHRYTSLGKFTTTVVVTDDDGGMGSASFAVTVRAPQPGDFDGDFRADLTLYRPSTGLWQSLRTATGIQTTSFGAPSVDIPVPADYDGDGKTDLAVFRPTTGQWLILQSTAGARVTPFGAANLDIPIPADYDGDGKADLAVYRPTTGQWLILQSTAGARVTSFGAANLDTPIPADYDGDGKADLAVFRPTTAQWLILQSTAGARVVPFGAAGLDKPIPADYDGDGKADIAVFRPTTAQWLILQSTAGARVVSFGAAGIDVPVPLDYDNDGKADIAVYRKTSGQWLILQSTAGAKVVPFGAANLDVPAIVPLAYRYGGGLAHAARVKAMAASTRAPVATPDTFIAPPEFTPLGRPAGARWHGRARRGASRS